MAKKADCPSCDGYGDHGVEEESGCLYVCYCCGGSGRVDEAVALGWRAAESWNAYLMVERQIEEIASRKARGYTWGIGEQDDEPGPFARVAWPILAAPVDYSEDIPF